MAARAAISRSEESADKVAFTEGRSDGDRSDISLRHSVARASKMASVIKRDLGHEEVLSPGKHAETEKNNSRPRPGVPCHRFPAFRPNALLELTAQFTYLSGAIGSIVGEAREFLGVGGIFWACGEESGRGREAGRDELNVIRCEWNMHAAWVVYAVAVE